MQKKTTQSTTHDSAFNKMEKKIVKDRNFKIPESKRKQNPTKTIDFTEYKLKIKDEQPRFIRPRIKLGKKNRTRQLLGVPLVNISLSNNVETVWLAANLPLEIVKHELLIGGVESESRRESLSACEEIRIHPHLQICRVIRGSYLGDFWECVQRERGKKPCKKSEGERDEIGKKRGGQVLRF